MYSNLALFLDISEKSKFEMQIGKSMPKGQMEKSMPKAQTEKKLDYEPFTFDISTTGKNSF